MNQFPDHDQPLVTFLQKNRPLPPPANPEREQQLMKLIQRNSVVSRQKPTYWSFYWLFPSAIAVSLVLVWGGYRLFTPPQPQVAVDPVELEAFMVSSWNGTFESSSKNGPEADWLLLGDLPTHDSESNP
jgi:hypothetical protein